MKKRFLLCLALMFMLFIGYVHSTGQQDDVVFINLGTCGTSGTYFPIGGGFADIWNTSIEGINATAQSTGCSVANLNLMKEGQIEASLNQNDAVFYAVQGKAGINKYEDVRGLFTMHVEPFHVVTLDKNINSIYDLRGKRVSVGGIGSIITENCKQLFRVAGMDIDEDIKKYTLQHTDAAAALKDGVIDAFMNTIGAPAAIMQDIAAQHELHVVPIDGELRDQVIKEYPFFAEYVLPANTYRGQTEDVEMISVKAMLCVDKSMDEEVAYKLVKAIFENLDRVKASHAVGSQITLENALKGMPVDLHPGAARYFKEVGILK